jgi:hypothetical protein
MLPLFFAIFSLFPSFISADVAMQGIHIHDSDSKLEAIKIEVVASDFTIKTPMIKYRTTNGNDLSVTTKKGKVVYMENDWLHEQSGNQPLVSDLIFGQTSLREIRTKFGFNGYVHKRHSYMKTKRDLVMFNCFELSTPKDVIFVTITAMPLDAEVTEETVADHLKLEALVLSDKKFLDEIWGAEKAYDATHVKVSL